MRLARLLITFAVATAGSAVAAAVPALADEGRHVVIVQGASGEPQYATLHRGWVNALSALMRDRFKIDPANLHVLTEQPSGSELRSTAENVRTVFAGLAATAKADDLVFVMMIGHGTGDAASAKFNLIGPDLTAAEWSGLLKPIQARLAVVDSTSSSFPFLAGLAGPNRVVITATGNYAQRYHTVFPDAFIRALAAEEADADKNGRISLLEAFTEASRLVERHFEQVGYKVTEHAMLDDTGDGQGRTATTAGEDGVVAGLTYLDVATVASASNPEVQALLNRQHALTEQIDDLRRRRPAMGEEAFEREFETLIVELSLVSRDLRRRTGG
jgi:hypothetical protein